MVSVEEQIKSTDQCDMTLLYFMDYHQQYLDYLNSPEKRYRSLIE